MNLNLNPGPVPVDLPPQATSETLVLALFVATAVPALISAVLYSALYVSHRLVRRVKAGAR
jgi:hypothetical protein